MTKISVSAGERLGSLSKDKKELLTLLRERDSRQARKIRAYPRSNSTGGVQLPTSWAQRRLWFIHQLEGGSAGYQVPLAFRLRGSLDQKSLHSALNVLVQRHEMLRTVFVSAGGDPIQEIAPEARFALTTIDLSGYERVEQEAQVQLHKIDEVQEKFDLSVGPLIRSRLLKIQPEEHVLLLTMHHIIADGWSLGVLIRELSELYGAFLEGRGDPLEPLSIQYADYAQWQRQWVRGKVFEKQMSYWRTCLDGAASQLELPTDRPRPAVQSYRGGTVGVALDAQLSEKLKAFAQRHEMTLFMVLYAAWAILLSRLSGQEDMVIGMPIANRQRPEVEGLIGLFVNTLALRVAVHGNLQLKEFLDQVKEVTLRAYDNQDVPFEQVVEALRPGRSLSRNPLFQAMFVLHNEPRSELSLPGLAVTMEDAVDEPSILDLWMSLEERGAEIVGYVNYAAELFDRETIERWVACFTVLLRAIAGGVQSRVGDLPILPESERHQVLELFNATHTDYPHQKPIHVLFEDQVERTPNSVAVVYGEQSLTYAELNGRANQLANYLSKQGMKIGEYVPILMPRCLQMLIAQISVLKCGGTYVPIDPELPMERQAFMIRDCAARRILGERKMLAELEKESMQWIDCADLSGAINEFPRCNPKWSTNAPPPAYVMYTSGSTGVPKGVIVPHRAVNRLVINNGYAKIEPADCIAHCSNPAFDASTFEIWGALLNGARVLIVEQPVLLDVDRFAEALRKQRVTVLWLTVGLFVQYAEALAATFSGLRYLITGGDVVDPGTIRRVLGFRSPQHLLNAYGPTECTTFSTTYLIEAVDKDTRSIPIGRPISNTKIYILDDHLRPVPIGVAGEIYIGGAGVALGYLNRPELSAERFVADPFSTDPETRLYRSGDLGRWRADGNVEFLGRNDQQVKLRGFRIELGEIEAHLSRHSHVKEATVLAREDEPGEKRLVAYVVADLPKLKALQREGSDEAGAGIVAQWKTLYEETYSPGAPGPSFVGWNSSYTGQPIPESQMQEWLACTIERIQALQPTRVLEIGCGVGLLLQHLAPQCSVYVGTDFSVSALEQVQQWMNGREDLKHVELLHRSATELQDLQSGSFDTVVLNSVVQYFPDIEYLLAVLQEAVRLLSPGGRIFIGDVRHLGLLSMFHSAVQLSKAAASISVAQLRRRIARAVAQDKELVVDPQFFHALPRRVPGISAVDVHLKQGRAQNELTRYRYDVVLQTGATIIARAVSKSLEWQTSVRSAAELEAAMGERRWCAARLCSIPNLRLAREAAAQRLIETSNEQLCASALRHQLSELQFEEVDPQQFWEAGRAHNYEVTVSPAEQGCFEVQLLDRARADQVSWAEPTTDSVKPWGAYANDPLENGFRQQLIPQLREYLKGRLPEYMIPSAWMVLKQLPLTPNGKVDRRALPAPQTRPEELGEYIAPRTELERTLADLWAQLLRVDQVGVHDNFFELGGHSLLIVQMKERLRLAGLSTEVRSIYASPTVADLARTLTDETADEFVVPPNQIPPGCVAITPQMLPLVDLDMEQIERIVLMAPGGAGNIQDIYPLTPLQEGMLFHHLLNERGGDAYARSKLLSLPSRERLEEFTRALQEVIDRHDILRTAVLWRQLPRPVQVVYRQATLPVAELVLDPDRDSIEQLRERMKPERQRLDLGKAPLMRLEIAADANGTQWYALLQTHHLVFDNESLHIMLAEVMAYLEGRVRALPEPAAYRNHVAQALAHAQAHDVEAFFCSKLGDIDEPTAPFGLLDVHGDGSRTADARQTIDPALARRIRALARRLGMSAATLFHAGWALVVSCTSGRADVVYGTVLLGRMQGSAGTQRILGMLINTLPLRLRLQGATAKELVDETQRELVELFNHEQASLAVARNCSSVDGSAPLFSSLLSYRRTTVDFGSEFASAAGVTLLASQGGTNYPIMLSVLDQGEDFLLDMETDCSIDPHRVAGYMSTAVQSLVEALERAPHTPALMLTVLPERERQQVIELFNATEADFPQEKLIHELFEAQVQRTPGAIAMVCEGQALTYSELNGRANRLARYLRDMGVGPDQLVAICVERSVEMVVGLLGILKAGGAYVPLDPSYPTERLQYMLNDAAPRVLLTQERLRGTLPPTAAEVIALDSRWSEIAGCEDGNLDPRSLRLTSRHLAYVIYTSGSTGNPKGVMVEHAGVVNFLTSMQRNPGISATDCLLAVTTVSFDIAALEIYLPIVNGAKLVLASREAASDARLLITMLEEFDVTVLQATPATWQLLLSVGWSGRPNLKALCGGEALSTDLSAKLISRVKALWNLYGPTETTIWSCGTQITLPSEHGAAESIGRPIANTRVYILDHCLKPVPIGVTGEIYIGGAGVARGYLNRDELTAERFISYPLSVHPQVRLYKTGDLGRWQADGTIEYVGRNDHQVKIRGYRIELGEIEAQLARHERVKEAIVVAREDVPGEKRLVAYITQHSSCDRGVEELRTHLNALLPEHMVPSSFVVLESLPLTPNGKLDRRALPAPDLAALASRRYEAPQGPVEEVLAAIWQELLKVKRVGRQDNFFELGGHSLHGMKFIAEIAERFRVSLSVVAMFKYPTVEEMAGFVESLRSITDEPRNFEGIEDEEGVI